MIAKRFCIYFCKKIAVNKSALPFLVITPDSNRNKSIISYDISESEASKSKTIDSLLPKKAVLKFELTVPIGPEPIKDFVPSVAKKIKEKKKEKTESITTQNLKKEAVVKNEVNPVIPAPIVSTYKDSLAKDSLTALPVAPKVIKVAVTKVKPLKNYTQSIFETNLLQAHRIEPRIRNKENRDWVTGVLLVVVGIVCIINVSYRSRLRQLFNAFTSNRFVGQIVREENVMFQRINIFLSLLFLFVTSLFIFQIGRFYKMPFSSNSSFMNYSVILITEKSGNSKPCAVLSKISK